MAPREKRRQQWQQRTSASGLPRSTVDTALSPVAWILTPSCRVRRRGRRTPLCRATHRSPSRLFGRNTQRVSGRGLAGIATCYYGAERRKQVYIGGGVLLLILIILLIIFLL